MTLSPISIVSDGKPKTFELDDACAEKAESGRSGSIVRFAILVMSLLCLSSIMANIVCFNFVVLCMPGIGEETNANHTYVGYSKPERTWLFSAVAVGALVAVVPVSHATHAIGTRKVFFSAGMLTAFATLAIPFVAPQSIHAFMFLRFLQGVSFAVCMPTAGAVTSAWASLAQNGLFMATLTTFGQLSSVFSMPVSGQLCVSSLGWESVYFLHAVISFATFTAWYIIYRNQPGKHPWVTQTELGHIRRGKSAGDLQKYDSEGRRRTVPYVSILTTPSVWGVWVGALGDLIAVQLIHTFSPLYIREVLNYSVEKTGWTAALPVLFQFLVKIFAGHSSDSITGISETTKVRIFNTIALGASAVFLVALAFLPQGHSIWGIALITLATSMFGFNGGGFNKCATLVSRQYSHFVMANIQFVWCLSMLICPILVNAILRTGSLAEWRTVFLLHAAVLVVSNAIFCCLATAKPAPWTDPSITTSAKRNTPIIAA